MSKSQKTIHLHDLPAEILIDIISNLDYLTLHLSIKPVCSYFRSIVDEALHGTLGDNLHRSTTTKPLPPPPPLPPLSSLSISSVSKELEERSRRIDEISRHITAVMWGGIHYARKLRQKVHSLPPEPTYHPVLQNLGYVLDQSYDPTIEPPAGTTITEAIIPNVGVISDPHVPHTEEKYTARYRLLHLTNLLEENATNPPRETVYIYRKRGYSNSKYFRYTVESSTPGKPVTVGDVEAVAFRPVWYMRAEILSGWGGMMVEKLKVEKVKVSRVMMREYIWLMGLECRVDIWFKYGEENSRCYYDDEIGSCWIVADASPLPLTAW